MDSASFKYLHDELISSSFPDVLPRPASQWRPRCGETGDLRPCPKPLCPEPHSLPAGSHASPRADHPLRSLSSSLRSSLQRRPDRLQQCVPLLPIPCSLLQHARYPHFFPCLHLGRTVPGGRHLRPDSPGAPKYAPIPVRRPSAPGGRPSHRGLLHSARCYPSPGYGQILPCRYYGSLSPGLPPPCGRFRTHTVPRCCRFRPALLADDHDHCTINGLLRLGEMLKKKLFGRAPAYCEELVVVCLFVSTICYLVGEFCCGTFLLICN